MNAEGSGSLVPECRGGGSIASASPHVCWDPRLQLHVSCWSTEIVFSNRGARMLNFLEWFLCVLWVCACGHGPSRRESLARHLRTSLCVAPLGAEFLPNFHRRPQPPFTTRVLVGESGCILTRSILRGCFQTERASKAVPGGT